MGKKSDAFLSGSSSTWFSKKSGDCSFLIILGAVYGTILLLLLLLSATIFNLKT
ncbi:hypothetical protein DM01DRAFT_302224 [Hesseltinella vesiculosa]|uniref:Uncharacterized protein n=1 Tax=Hesseltinella vesiculosa TaxID=101127 RepID=A0A1X2GTA8_9FUNG|nr:hypothetical protein DM01DRAFT_302224 [Hesseltinella vesiculosa]